MSSELVWQIIKNNNSFLVKRQGVQFSSEPSNLLNVNTYKHSGLANYKSVGVNSAARGVLVTLKKAGKQQNPAKAKNAVVIAKSRRQTSKSVANLVARATKYRPDLRAAAVARASAIISTQQPKKAQKAKEAKGPRAQKKL